MVTNNIVTNEVNHHPGETQQPASHAIIAQQTPNERSDLKEPVQASGDSKHNVMTC